MGKSITVINMLPLAKLEVYINDVLNTVLCSSTVESGNAIADSINIPLTDIEIEKGKLKLVFIGKPRKIIYGKDKEVPYRNLMVWKHESIELVGGVQFPVYNRLQSIEISTNNQATIELDIKNIVQYSDSSSAVDIDYTETGQNNIIVDDEP